MRAAVREETPLSESSVEQPAKACTSRDRMIRRIAEALGKPETVFLDGSVTEDDFAAQCELLRVWDSLTSHADRQKVLAFARSVASVRSRSVQP